MMEACCDPDSAQSGRECPACGTEGRSVDRITVKAMLLPAALERAADGEYRFCAAPGCPVVYFGPSQRFRIDDLGVTVFQKKLRGARTVCYCFGVTVGDIEAELTASGRSTAVERISALVKAERCACEIKNPQGSCCLANVSAVVRSAELEAGTAVATKAAPA